MVAMPPSTNFASSSAILALDSAAEENATKGFEVCFVLENYSAITL
jgi:hypothetical protein